MRCKICGKYFDRGTTTLPFAYDYCDKCHQKYVKYETIERTQEEINEYYIDLINYCLKEIEECKKTIQENEELIEWTKQQIKEN